MSFLKLLNDLERISRQVERERIREAKEKARIQEKYKRNFAKQQRFEHVNAQKIKAEELTKEILDTYKNYDTFKDEILSTPSYFSFDNFKKKYVEAVFKYDCAKPIKGNKAEHIKVPKKTKLEKKFKFLKKRRLTLELKKETLEKKELDEFNLMLNKYEEEKNIALDNYKKQELNRKKEIDKHNNSIDNWKRGCLKHDKDCIDKFLAYLLNFFLSKTNDKIINKIQYSFDNNKLICEAYLKKERELFPCEGYRFYKQKDVIEPIKIKRNTVNTILKELIPNVAITLIDIIYKNDELNLFEEIIINVYYDRKCCSSIKLQKDEYSGFKLNNEDDYYYVHDHYMKNYKTLSTGVKPYDSIYMDLV